jgi:hypothetical protein
MAKSLYEASKGSIQEPLDPSQPVSSHFKTLLQALLQAPALRLPDLTHPFILYVSERQGFALGVLGHDIGPSFTPVAYLSKQLNPTTRGWVPCLRALAAASLLIQESKKLTFVSPLTVYSPHSLLELLTYKGLFSMPPSCILSLQVALVEDSILTFVLWPPLNPATCLPLSSTPLVHFCPEILEELLPCPDHIQEAPFLRLTTLGSLMAAPSFTMDSEELDMPSCLILPLLRHALSLWALLPRRQN